MLPPLASPTHVDGDLSRLVAVLVHRGAQVRCWSTADWERRTDDPHYRGPRWRSPWGGYVEYHPVLTVNLAPNECTMLGLLEDAKPPVWRHRYRKAFAWSLHVLTHESIHVNGRTDERTAECWGIQAMNLAATELGRSEREGRYLAQLYARDWYPHSRASYRSAECRDGGRLDLRPKSHIWP